MTEKKERKAGEFLITAAVLLVLAFACRYFPLLVVALPMPAIYVWQRFGPAAGLVFTGVFAAVLYFWAGGVWQLACIPPVLVACVGGIVVKKKVRSFTGVACCCGAAVLGCAAIVGGVCALAGTDFLSAVMAQVVKLGSGSQEGSLMAYYIMGALEVTQGNMSLSIFMQNLLNWSQEQMIAYITMPAHVDMLRMYLANLLPQVGMLYAAASGLLCYLAPRAIAKKRGASVAAVPPFSGFILPKSASPYFVVSILFAEIVFIAGWSQLYFAAYALYAGASFALAVQGLSLVYWFLLPKIKIKGLCAFLVVLIGLFLFTLMMWLGLFEQLIRIRDRKIFQGGR